MPQPTKPDPSGTVLEHSPPRHNVLLLSCMDVRLIDQLAEFMEHDNLTNRYDHLIFAGASLGVLQTTYPNWKNTFFEHVEIALELHQPEDVYIIEHRHCGAYRKFLGLEFGDSPQNQERERDVHRDHAFTLSQNIADWCAKHSKAKGKPVHLNVHCFLMDLRGRIELLQPPDPVDRPKKPASRRKKS